MQKNDQKFLQATGHRPVIGKQQFDQGSLFVGRPAPEHGHGNHLYFLFRVFQAKAHQLVEFVGGHQLLAAPPEQAGNALVQEEKSMAWAILDWQRVVGPWQFGSTHFLLQHQAAGQGAVLKHVANRFVRVQAQRFQGVAADIGPDPQKQDFAKKRQDQVTNALVKSHVKVSPALGTGHKSTGLFRGGKA